MLEEARGGGRETGGTCMMRPGGGGGPSLRKGPGERGVHLPVPCLCSRCMTPPRAMWPPACALGVRHPHGPCDPGLQGGGGAPGGPDVHRHRHFRPRATHVSADNTGAGGWGRVPGLPYTHLLPSPALPCPALPCPALPCPVLPCPALPCPALCTPHCPALPCPALPCCALLYSPSPQGRATELTARVLQQAHVALLVIDAK